MRSPTLYFLSLLLTGGFAIIVPGGLNAVRKEQIAHYQSWKEERDEFKRFNQDYPFGWPGFDCPITPLSPPKDIHSLAPQHISVVAAIGDSLTAGRAALSETLSDMGKEYRGVSFAIGGDESLQTKATIPNLLRHYSPHLRGFSLGESLEDNVQLSNLNLAVSGSVASDLLPQAKALVFRMKKLGVDLEKEWKFVNVFIGSNDLCRFCLNMTRFSVEQYIVHLNETIIYLKNNLPRTYVNLMPPFNVYAAKEAQRYPFCIDSHSTRCTCLAEMSAEEYKTLRDSYFSSLAVFADEMFHNDNFSVNVAPAIANVERLPTVGSSLNIAFIALDCFHFSAIAHDLVAKVIWKNLFEPITNRSEIDTFDHINTQIWTCPPQDCPYFRTPKNSHNCTVYYQQPKAMSPKVQVKLPSVSDLEKKANKEEFQFSLVLIIIAVLVVVLLIVVLVFFLRERKRRKNLQCSEETPLLLTANLYDNVF